MSLTGRQQGFTLTEILVVVALLLFVLLLFFVNMRTQVDKGHDAERKADLHALQKSFEEYYNDNNCYPGAAILDNCNSADLSPYLPTVPCDPTRKTPYLFVPHSDSACKGYAVCAALQNLADPDIARAGCNPITGCGWGEGYNYCLSVGMPSTAVGFDAGATPTPTPDNRYQGNLACTPGGTCDNYDNPQAQGCPVSFNDAAECTAACQNPANWCPI